MKRTFLLSTRALLVLVLPAALVSASCKHDHPMSDNAVTMAGIQFMAVTRRVLREPFTARAWRTFLYCLYQPFVDLFGLLVVVLVVVVSTASAALLALPLIPPTLGFARWLGSVHRVMGRRLLDVDVPDPSRAPLVIEGVGFSHPGRERVLDRVDLTLEPGRRWPWWGRAAAASRRSSP